MVDLVRAGDLFTDRSAEYGSAEPFPHAVFTGLFDRNLLLAAADEFPAPAAMEQHMTWATEFDKFAESRWERFGPATQELVSHFQSGTFVDLLERLSGITGLIADSHLAGGGQHMIGPGGYLKIHADFNRYLHCDLDRRLNVLLYLNEPWDTAWGGSLELWNQSMDRAVVRVPPTLGTMVVFSTTSTSYHGHPDALRCPPNVYRKSLAFYYYTVGRPVEEQRPAHTTLFRGRPGTADRQALAAATGRTSTDVTSTDVTSSIPIVRHHLGRARDHLREAIRATLHGRT